MFAKFILTFYLIIFSLCYAKPSFIRSSETTYKNVVFLIPGAGSSAGNVYINPFFNFFFKLISREKYFEKFKNSFSSLGFETYICPTEHYRDVIGLEERAKLCAQTIYDFAIGEKSKLKIFIIGHSMGGLVARLIPHQKKIRFLLKHLNKDKKRTFIIDSILTISTPHRGTILADFVLDRLKAGGVYSWVLKMISFTPKYRNYLKELRSIRADNEDSFKAQDVSDIENIDYFSISTGSNNLAFESQFTSALIKKELFKNKLKDEFSGKLYSTLNDGMIPTYSQIYGKHLLNLNVSHFESACVDLYKNSKGCQKVLKVVVKFLKSRVKMIKTSDK